MKDLIEDPGECIKCRVETKRVIMPGYFPYGIHACASCIQIVKADLVLAEYGGKGKKWFKEQYETPRKPDIQKVPGKVREKVKEYYISTGATYKELVDEFDLPGIHVAKQIVDEIGNRK